MPLPRKRPNHEGQVPKLPKDFFKKRERAKTPRLAESREQPDDFMNIFKPIEQEKNEAPFGALPLLPEESGGFGRERGFSRRNKARIKLARRAAKKGWKKAKEKSGKIWQASKKKGKSALVATGKKSMGLLKAGRAKSGELISRDWQRTKRDLNSVSGKLRAVPKRIAGKYRAFKARRTPDARIQKQQDFLTSRIDALETRKGAWQKRSRIAEAKTAKGFSEHLNLLNRRFWSTRSKPVGKALKGFADWRVKRNQQMIDLEKRRLEVLEGRTLEPAPQITPAKPRQRRRTQ